MKNYFTVIFISIISTLILAQPVFADEAALAKESEAYVKSTVPTRPTPPQMIIDKVNTACALLETEGIDAYTKFKGNGSSFLFEGTYIWIHNIKDGTMMMHPIKKGLVGKKLLGLKDKNGKRFIAVMSSIVKNEGSGWVSYIWPKPGSKEFTKKVSYVKKCAMKDVGDVVLGCGLYHFTDESLKNLNIR